MAFRAVLIGMSLLVAFPAWAQQAKGAGNVVARQLLPPKEPRAEGHPKLVALLVG